MEIKSPANSRNLGIDCLRILSMFMVLVLHILGAGGILDNAEKLSWKYEMAWLLEIACYCAVNCYAIISGYVMAGKNIRYRKIVTLWTEVCFYALIITGILDFFTNAEISKGLYFCAVTPIISEEYWYFTAYFGMFLFLPLINPLLEKLPKRDFKRILIYSFLWFSIFPTLRQSDSFRLNSGYCTWWLILLYFVGVYIKRFVCLETLNKWKCGAVYLGCILFTWANRWGIEALFMKISPENAEKYGELFIHYTSPFFVISAIALFLLFVQLKPQNKTVKQIILFLSKHSFSVYLIHMLVFIYLWQDRFIWLLQSGTVLMIFQVIGLAIIMYLACSCIDWMRMWIFAKLKVDSFVQKFCDKIGTAFNRII